MAQQNWVENPAKEADEHHHRSGHIKVEQQEWIVVDKVKRAGDKRGDDGGPHHHHDGGGELGGVAEDRGRTPHSIQQGEGQEDVLEEVNVGSKDLYNRFCQLNCSSHALMSDYEVLESCNTIGVECLLNLINSFMFQPRKL